MPDETSVAPSTRGGRPRLLLRGESAVASIGIASAAILLVAMAALGWWTMRAHNEQMRSWQAARLESIGTRLTEKAERLLAAGELSALRREVAEVAQAEGLHECRIVIGADQVLADAEVSRINVQHLPERWSSLVDAAGVPEPGADDALLRHAGTVLARGRGPATLHLSMPAARLWDVPWEMQAGIGLIGAASLSVLLLVYRRLRLRMRGIGAVRDALLAAARGETGSAALRVKAQLGDEAVAWNGILDQLQALKNQLNAEQARQVLAARRGAKSDLDAAFDALSQGLILVDDQLQVRYANGAAAVFLQVKRDQLIGTDVSRWIAQDEVLGGLRGVSDGTLRRRTSIEVEQKMPSGASTVLRFTIRPVRREDSASGMVMIEDITQQRVAAESRNSFVAQATHELRTPLTNIRLYVETAIEEGDKDPLVRGKCLNVINQETRRLERIVGEMLSVAEIEAGSLKIRRGDLRVDQLVNELRLDFQEQADEKRIKLTFDLPPKMPVVQADRDKVAVALHNLVGNALKYTPNGGQVTVKLDVEPSQLVFSVTDTGIGISEEDQAKIFERFYRADDPRVEQITGSGLGLTLAREVVRLHGGDITVRSELNKGSTFTLTLSTTTTTRATEAA